MNQKTFKLNLRNDYVFKMMHYIDEEKGKKIFASIIQAFTGIEVKDVVFQQTDLYPLDVNGKDVRFDLCATVNTKNNTEIEMQMYHMKGLPERILYNAAILFTRGKNKGSVYSELEEATCVALCANNVFPHLQHYEHHFCFADMEKGVILTEKMKIHIIELKKGIHQLMKKRIDEFSMMEMWIYFLMRYEEESDDPIVQQLLEREEIFRMVKEVLQMISQDELARQRAWAREVNMRDEAQRRHDAEERDAKMAKVESENTELKSALIESEAKNTELKSENTELKSENTELKEKYQEAILSMIKAGISDEMIMKYMGCTFESLDTLKKEMNDKER